MGKKKSYYPLDVYHNGGKVGRLVRRSDGAISFTYDENWLHADAVPVSLSLPPREDPYTGQVVFNVFDNLLPDNEDIRKRIAERMDAQGTDAYSLLMAIGRDCVGALEFLPEGDSPTPPDSDNATPLSDEDIERMVSALGSAPLAMHRENDFRISLAGAQEKTALLQRAGKWYLPHGATPTTHILKPRIGKTPYHDLTTSVENEYLCLKLARAIGLPVAHASMERFGNARVLVVERFDRKWLEDGTLVRVPQEDCCQALSFPPTQKYAFQDGPDMRAILRMLQASDTPRHDQVLFLQAHAAFWLMGATDGHAKNFSIFLREGGRFTLTPLYDILSAQPDVDAARLRHKDYKLAMPMGDRRHYRMDEIQPRHFVETWVSAGLPAKMAEEALASMAAKVDNAIDEATSALPQEFPMALADAIFAGMRKRGARMAA